MFKHVLLLFSMILLLMGNALALGKSEKASPGSTFTQTSVHDVQGKAGWKPDALGKNAEHPFGAFAESGQPDAGLAPASMPERFRGKSTRSVPGFVLNPIAQKKMQLHNKARRVELHRLC